MDVELLVLMGSGGVGALLGAGLAAAAPWRNAGLAVLKDAISELRQQNAELRGEIDLVRRQQVECEKERAEDRALFAAELVELRQRLTAAGD